MSHTLLHKVREHLSAHPEVKLPAELDTACVKAINAVILLDDGSAMIPLPDGTAWAGVTSVPAWALIEAAKLGDIINQINTNGWGEE